ncbi:outer membrane protein [Leadbettera azotonutricia ZAS-9]|uniref:Outer membrane protein n=2 Tax=Leadbettera azotonutricia TaxID=150829 RepID=F5Y8X0_LEAAZ|nr:outer membrane protein [Leadbettera azotonutricia ZAS-9]
MLGTFPKDWTKEYGMKQGSFRVLSLAMGLILMAGIAVFSAFGDENTVDYAAIVIDTFDGNTNHEWTVGSKTYSYDFIWKLDASKFATKTEDDAFPKLTYVPSWPMAVFGANRDGKDLKSIGIWGKFDRRGYNWVDLYPATGEGDDQEAFEIPIPGRISYLDMWVWGANLNYYLEAYVRDYNGVVHNIYVGNIGFQGWKNMRVAVPNNIRQSKRILPRLAGLTFVKFRIWTTPLERVDNFYVYIDQFKVLTDTFESLYDGDELADPERVQEFWANN